MADEKHCPRCDEDWPADTAFFYADVTSKDGLFYCCKACHVDLRKTPVPRQLATRPTDELAQLRWVGAGQ